MAINNKRITYRRAYKYLVDRTVVRKKNDYVVASTNTFRRAEETHFWLRTKKDYVAGRTKLFGRSDKRPEKKKDWWRAQKCFAEREK